MTMIICKAVDCSLRCDHKIPHKKHAGCDTIICKNKSCQPVKPVEYSMKWEHIGRNIIRLKVPGGWLISNQYDLSTSTCFLPDADHKWILEWVKK